VPDRKQILNSLAQVKPALAGVSPIPALACFAFKAGRVWAHDGVAWISNPIALDITDVCVAGAEIYKWLARQTKDEVIATLDGSTVTWKCGRSTLRQSTLHINEFPSPAPPRGESSDLPEDFLEALDLATRTMGTDPSHRQRYGAILEWQEEKLVIWTSDNLSLVRLEMYYEGGLSPQGLIGITIGIPPTLVKLLARTVGFVEVSVGEMVTFTADAVTYSALQLPDVNVRKLETSLASFDFSDVEEWSPITEELEDGITGMAAYCKSLPEPICRMHMTGETLTLSAGAKVSQQQTVMDWPRSCPPFEIMPQSLDVLLPYVDVMQTARGGLLLSSDGIKAVVSTR
jgi:hypothetical protein